MSLPPTDTSPACRTALGRLRGGDPAAMAAWLRDHLFTQVLPFWERHGFGESAGLQTCLADDGRLLSGDKWLWSQWRAVWVFSRIYNRHGRDPKWLERARRIVEFCTLFGWDDAADGWALLLAADGRILRGNESIYTDGFAVYGLLEYHRATGDAAALRLADRTAEAARKKLAGPPAAIPHFPYPIPAGAKPHGLPMFWSLILAELGDFLKSDRYRHAAAGHAGEIFRDFYRPDRNLVLEFVREDGREYPPPQGTAVVPGHVIEDMWFQIHVSELLGQSPVRVDEACRLILRHLELGWDHAHGGGLLLAVDADGRESVGWKYAETKLWWPLTEALYAALLGWEKTRRPVFLDWYERCWQVCLDHYVNWVDGEWRQKLDRNFQPVRDTVALPVKDPFHLPRSLLLQIELLGRLGARSA